MKIKSYIIFCLLLTIALPAWADGWYLRLPPDKLDADGNYHGNYDGKAPISNWQNIQSYDFAKDCENRKTRELNEQLGRLHEANEEMKRLNKDHAKSTELLESLGNIHLASLWVQRWGEARCISNNDPGLK